MKSFLIKNLKKSLQKKDCKKWECFVLKVPFLTVMQHEMQHGFLADTLWHVKDIHMSKSTISCPFCWAVDGAFLVKNIIEHHAKAGKIPSDSVYLWC